MTNLVALKAANANRWAHAKMTRNFTSNAKALLAAKSRYQSVEAKTGVPWFVIAVIHERESSQNWFCSLAQGDPWNRVSTHVPKGRGPFTSWEEAAIDALTACEPFLARSTDWSTGGALTALERYNGLGYAARRVPSPYVWAGTDQYRRGKYIRDGIYDSYTIDSQPGCAGLLLALIALDPTIKFGRPIVEAAALQSPTHEMPSVAHPAKGSIGAFIASLFSTIFKRKNHD